MEPIFDNSGLAALKVPGFGLPIDFELDEKERFQHGTDKDLAERRTIHEIAMIGFMDAVTDKPHWNEEVFKNDIVAKWKDDAMVQHKGLMSELAFDWCIEELKDNAKSYSETGFVKTLESGFRCMKSDTIISDQLRDELKRAVQRLFQTAEQNEHRHPFGKFYKVLTPSLYPLIYGKTRVLPAGFIGLEDYSTSCKPDRAASRSYGDVGGASAPYQHGPVRQFWSNRLQWLPAEVKFNGDTGTDVRITSYINNLRPGLHQDMYTVIEQLISRAIPAWNQVLTLSNERVPLRIRVSKGEGWNARMAFSDDTRQNLYSNPSTLHYGDWKELCGKQDISLEKQFRHQGLQVIVRLESCDLEANEPYSIRASWFLEGKLNEHIVATAIYYYDAENIGPTGLRFRQDASHYNKNGDIQEEIFGIHSSGQPAIQTVGSISTPTNRFLVFPNTRQQKPKSFSLIDRNKPGHLRSLVVRLVDPHYRLVSTANVPPQQPEWFKDAAQKTGFGRKLPQEVMDMIMEYATSDLMSLDEVEKTRRDLVLEKFDFNGDLNESRGWYDLVED